uniref:Uncharacterized protein n=1 Tax=Chenopodium quinoa TaxID=63459 RepID=A0A803LDR8_CHEQI
MATMGIRSAMASGARLMAVRSKPSSFSLTPKQLLASSSSNRPISSASRLASMLGMVESQKPLHSAIASARLTSILALDSSCWSCLSLVIALGVVGKWSVCCEDTAWAGVALGLIGLSIGHNILSNRLTMTSFTLASNALKKFRV